MCDKELLVGYVYDDISDMDRVRFERHLRECAACRGEVGTLRSVRADLTAWTLPQSDLGFRLVQGRSSSWRAWWTPAFGLAAAAVLVLAAASAVAHIEITYGANGVAVRSGWNDRPTAGAALVQTSSLVDSSKPAPQRGVVVDPAVLADLNRRLHDLEAASQTASPRAATVSGNRMTDGELRRFVRDLVAQSESRQTQELALRIAQVMRDVDAQRVADLRSIQQGFGRIDAMTTAEAATHRELANYILTSSKQQK